MPYFTLIVKIFGVVDSDLSLEIEWLRYDGVGRRPDHTMDKLRKLILKQMEKQWVGLLPSQRKKVELRSLRTTILRHPAVRQAMASRRTLEGKQSQ